MHASHVLFRRLRFEQDSIRERAFSEPSVEDLTGISFCYTVKNRVFPREPTPRDSNKGDTQKEALERALNLRRHPLLFGNLRHQEVFPASY